MTNYPYPPNPYGPPQGSAYGPPQAGSAVPGAAPGSKPYGQQAASPDPYAASLPQAGTPYPGYGPVVGGYPGAQPYPGPQPAMGAYPATPVYDPVMAQVQQLAAASARTSSNLLGYWALGLSVLSLLCCTYGVGQVLGIGLGIAGLVAASNGHADNKGVSVAAIVVGLLSIVVWIGIGYYFSIYAAETGY
ncbi:DUF4190 domain-containing protein [Actinomyces weissii]|nr:DUF4190 domain-containing protein [Actinomyces weissii]